MRSAEEPSFSRLAAMPAFRLLWVAQAGSLLGDQWARVALAVLVYGQTHSALLAALTYALGFVPYLVAAPVLSVLADRVPRRRVMVASDSLRACLVLAMAVPGEPLPVLLTLLFLLTTLSPAFETARAALLPDLVGARLYPVALSVGTATAQLSQLIGFAAGGVAVAVAGPRLGLLADAASFAVSALVVQTALSGLPAGRQPASAQPESGPWRRLVVQGAREVWSARFPRALLLLAWSVAAVTVVPEGIAAPLVHRLRTGSWGVGLVMAAAPGGLVLGAVAFGRYLPAEARRQVLAPAAALSVAALAVAGSARSLGVLVGLVGAAGFATGFVVPLQAEFVRAVRPEVRGRAVGLAQTGYMAAQGAALLLAGAAAQWAAATAVLAGAGVLGVAAVGLIWASWPVRAPRGASDRRRPAEAFVEVSPRSSQLTGTM